MATAPKAVVTEKVKRKPCKPCVEHHHQSGSPRCNSLCTCWCRTGEFTQHQPFRPASRVPEWRHADLTLVLATLRERGVRCRTTSEGKLLWKPRPADLPDEVATLIRENRQLLTLVLEPHREPDLRQRQYWTHGGVRPCSGCGRPTLLIDPLGEHRHYWCGWVKQLAH